MKIKISKLNDEDVQKLYGNQRIPLKRKSFDKLKNASVSGILFTIQGKWLAYFLMNSKMSL